MYGSNRVRLQKLLKIGLLAAIAAVLMITLQFPLLPSSSFLKYDFSGIPVLVAAFALGPVEGVGAAALKDLLFLFARPGPEDLIGVPMNFIAISVMAYVAGMVYSRFRTKKGALLSLLLGTLATTLAMVPANLLIYPIFARIFLPGIPEPAWRNLIELVVACVIPFNLLKGAIDSLVVFILYKRVAFFFKAREYVEPICEGSRRR